jgi:hypothetical protein
MSSSLLHWTYLKSIAIWDMVRFGGPILHFCSKILVLLGVE